MTGTVYAVALPYGGKLWRVVEVHPTEHQARDAATLYALKLGKRRDEQTPKEVRIYAVSQGTQVGALVSGEPMASNGH